MRRNAAYTFYYKMKASFAEAFLDNISRDAMHLLIGMRHLESINIYGVAARHMEAKHYNTKYLYDICAPDTFTSIEKHHLLTSVAIIFH